MSEIRLIDANALKKKFPKNDMCDYEEFCEFIDNAPTVEPEVYMTGKDYNLYLEGYKQGKKDFGRPQGEWIYKNDCPCCPFCNHFYTIFSNFCPNCGAKMKGGAE